MAQHAVSQVEPLPAVRAVPTLACLTWLRLGLADLRAAWTVSLAHGVLFAGLGWLLVSPGWRDAHWGIAFTSGFLLVAPLLATCFYAISRAQVQSDTGATETGT